MNLIAKREELPFNLLSHIGQYINWNSLYILAISIAGYLTCVSQGVFIEDAQTVFLPAFLLAIWTAPKSVKYRIPGPIAGLILFLWLGSALEVRGLLPVTTLTKGVFLELLNTDTRSSSWERRRVYNEAADQFNFPQMTLIHRQNASTQDARRWLEGQSKGLLLIRGDSVWSEVVFKQNISGYLADDYLVDQESLKELIPVELLSNLGLVNGEGFFFIREPFSSNLLAVQIAPEKIDLPSNVADLSDRFTGWLASGLGVELSQSSFSTLEKAKEFEKRRSYLQQAATVVGPWLSAEPQALGYFFLATHEFLGALNSQLSNSNLFECSLKSFRTAAGFVREAEDPETFSAIFNNAAIAEIVSSNRQKDFYKARGWLRRAADVRTKNSEIPLGAKLALLNLILIDRYELN